MQIKCHMAETPEDKEACLAIRRHVFIEEQQVPESRERDGEDTKALHFLAAAEGKNAGACRVRILGSTAKIERVAVLPESRGSGVGRVLMRFVLQEMQKKGDIQLFKLSSQADAVPFYEKLGFIKRGAEYMDAGIPHYDMIRETGQHA